MRCIVQRVTIYGEYKDLSQVGGGFRVRGWGLGRWLQVKAGFRVRGGRKV